MRYHGNKTCLDERTRHMESLKT